MKTRKYTAAIIIGMAPLLFLTIGTIVRGVFTGTSLAGPPSTATLESDLQAARQWIQQGTEDQRQLGELAALAADPMQASTPALAQSNSENMTVIWTRWENVVRERNLLRKVAFELQTRRELSEISDAAISQGIQNLKKLRDEAKADDHPGRDKLCTVIDAELHSLEQEQQRRQVAADNLQLLAGAKAAFAQDRYNECITMLSAWQGAISPEADSLRTRSRFFEEATFIEERLRRIENSEPADSWPPVLDDVRRFLARRPPSSTDDDIRTCYESIDDKLAILDARYHLGTLTAPNDLLTWARKVKQSLSTYSTPQTRQKVRSLLTAWLRDGLPRKIPDSRNMLMAVDANGDLLEGYFEPQENGRWYKYYANMSRELARKSPNAWGAKMAKSLQQPPVEIPTSRLVKAYEEARGRALDGTYEESVWRDLLQQLREWQDTLDEYRRLGGLVDVSFQKEIEFCQFLVDNWREVGPLFEEIRGL